MGSCLDLRKFQDPTAIEDAFAKIVSGKSGYKPVIERRIEPTKCKKCGKMLENGEKFCPICGEKAERKPVSIKCKKCDYIFNGDEMFCAECGVKRE